MMHLKLKSHQWLVDDNNRIIMGKGRMEILEQIENTGSINQAAKVMKMSYKGVWSKIKSTEKHMGIKILHTDKKEGSWLTTVGKELLEKYRRLRSQCEAADDNIFNRIFKEQPTPPILSIVGNSGSGKTTFIEKLIAELTRHGLRVGSIKHDVHGFEMDKPGKDSWRHKQAGASVTIISSPRQIGMVQDVDHDHTPDQLSSFFPGMDLIITEGFKFGNQPKLEVYRPEATGRLLCGNDAQLLALISDAATDLCLPVFSPADPEGAAAFIIAHFNLASPV